MIIDLTLVILLVLAVFKGFKKGLIVGIFSFLAIIIGLAAAMKLSTVVAGYIGQSVNVSDEWLPVISFAAVFIVVVLLIRWGATAIEKIAETVLLGWLNKLGGIIFFSAFYITIFSVILFYAVQLQLIKPETIDKSVTYSFVQPWGPKAINSIGTLIPFFRDMFTELQQFFGDVSDKITPS